ncbi:MAG TPA: Gfo/Idh/MocA family oxidoreductase [Bryobacteraceae bacterium]|jgi:predicted dehydrogenase
MNVAAIGGGMIMQDQILPSLYQLRRLGRVDSIAVCARHAATLDALAAHAPIKEAFPGFAFEAHAGEYTDLLQSLPPRQLVVVALPDSLHFAAVMAALAADQHVLCVKPLVLRASESIEIENEARRRGLLVAIEYHKRFDDRSLMARRLYKQGAFGEFRLGNACLHEKWNYRHSNFQNWFTPEQSDAFTYIGCHYVDLVHFITGLRPTSVSVHGIKDKFPNGVEGYLWTDARVVWENGACLNVQNSLGYPQQGPGSNLQGLTMFLTGGGEGAMIRHSDQYRGLEYVDRNGYSEPSPDYFRYVDRSGSAGLEPVGYGYRSIEQIVAAVQKVEASSDRIETLRTLDEEGLIATPANSRFNELTVEAGRLSLFHSGREALIDYQTNSVALR